MGESRITVPSPTGDLEGLYDRHGETAAVAITHPHPLYGGDMTSPVVEAIAAAYGKKGVSTLRFNFRGTGGSAGTYDGGSGEQDDVRAAVRYLQAAGFERIHLAGYSFGAWVNANALQYALPVQSATMVAPPVAFIGFTDTLRLPMLSVVVAGSEDEFAPPEQIQPLMANWAPRARLQVIAGADHFFFGFLDAVSRALAAHI